jgi:6-phosphogluconate dehydrogenase
MDFGIVGLGRMGEALALHAKEKGHQVTGYDANESARDQLQNSGIRLAESLKELTAQLPATRIVFVYVPHGEATESVCNSLRELLAPGDIVVDGGNSDWRDSMQRCEAFAKLGIHFLDMGTSGGVMGAREGACFMVGGERSAFETIRPILRDLAVDDLGFYHTGASGTGHFTKLVHNAIEFGMVQSIAEGVELLQRSDFDLDLPALCVNWQHGSVIRSWLVELMGKALAEKPDFDQLSTYVEDTGEVKWVLQWAFERDIPAPAINTSQVALMQYRDLESPTAKAVALLRNQYGEHPVHRANERHRV